MQLLSFLNCSTRFLQGTLFFYFPLLLKEVGFNGWQIGILLSIYALAPVLLSIPAGVLNDRVNSRTLITLSMGGYALFYFLLISIKDFLTLVPVFVIGGASANLLAVSLQALALKLVRCEERGRQLGFFQGYAYLGFAMGLLSGGFLLSSKMLLPLLWGASIVYILLMAAAHLLRENTPVSINLLEYAHDFRQKNVLLFCLVYSVFAFHWGSEASSYSLFLTQYFGLDKMQIAFYMAPPIAMLGVTAILAGLVMDRNVTSSRALVIIGFLASGIGQVLMVLPNVYASLAMRIIHEIGDGIAILTFTVAMSRMFRVEKIGGLSSIVTFTNILSQSLGILVFSRMGEVWGYQYPTVLGGASVLVACMLIVGMKEEGQLT